MENTNKYLTEFQKLYCKECLDNSKCPYIPRQLEHKCQELDFFTRGYEKATEDAINYLTKFLPLQLEYLDNEGFHYCKPSKEEFIIGFKKEMEK